MPTTPTLEIPIFDAVWRVAKVEAAERAKVQYERVSWPGRPLCFVKVNDLWVMREDGPWVIAYRLVLQDGRLVIGELRVYPLSLRAEGHPETGIVPPWDAVRDLQGVHAPAPAGGLTATVVHRITPGRDVNSVGRSIMDSFRESTASGPKAGIWKHLQSLGIQTPAPPASEATRAGGPLGKGHAFYRKAARVYLEAPARPVQAVAKALGISPARARDTIYRARHRLGLLPPTGPGKASGAAVNALQRIATEAGTGRAKTPQVKVAPTKNARQSTRGKGGR